ncbi:hypothetical protein GO491_10955 [Flavobacteriaceae bacterium Ap0902]|nr:hypothetical protein [Flavobacteriaceae bacterium Ap0902]
MNKLIYISFCILLSIGVYAQTADEIVQKHFEVTGGQDNWKALSSIQIKGEVAVGVGEVVPIVIEHKRPYFKRVSYVIYDKEILNEGFDGKQAYTYDESDGGFKMLPGYTPDAFETDLLNYDRKGFKLSLIGKEKVNGTDAYKVKLIKNTIEDFYWFDAETYNLIKEENQIETIYYSNFRRFGKLIFATRMENLPVGGKEYVVLFTDVQPNASIPDKRFKFN